MAVAFPLLQPLARLSLPTVLSYVHEYHSFCVCIYMFIYSGTYINIYIFEYSMYRVYVLEIMKMLSMAF